MKRPAIFLDRDGTLIEEVNYLSRVEDLRVFPFSAEAVEKLKKAGFLIVVVTNQSGIGRGIYSEADTHHIHAAIQQRLGGAIDAFYFCPHLPSDGCICRKPRTGMIDAAIREIEIERSGSWMVGDKSTDIDAGHSAGLLTAFVLTGYGSYDKPLLKHTPKVLGEDFGEVADAIINFS